MISPSQLKIVANMTFSDVSPSSEGAYIQFHITINDAHHKTEVLSDVIPIKHQTGQNIETIVDFKKKNIPKFEDNASVIVIGNLYADQSLSELFSDDILTTVILLPTI
jgi:hypothetical protein